MRGQVGFEPRERLATPGRARSRVHSCRQKASLADRARADAIALLPTLRMEPPHERPCSLRPARHWCSWRGLRRPRIGLLGGSVPTKCLGSAMCFLPFRLAPCFPFHKLLSQRELSACHAFSRQICVKDKPLGGVNGPDPSRGPGASPSPATTERGRQARFHACWRVRSVPAVFPAQLVRRRLTTRRLRVLCRSSDLKPPPPHSGLAWRGRSPTVRCRTGPLCRQPPAAPPKSSSSRQAGAKTPTPTVRAGAKGGLHFVRTKRSTPRRASAVRRGHASTTSHNSAAPLSAPPLGRMCDFAGVSCKCSDPLGGMRKRPERAVFALSLAQSITQIPPAVRRRSSPSPRSPAPPGPRAGRCTAHRPRGSGPT